MPYESPWGTLAVQFRNSDNSRQVFSTDGGFVLHKGGLTFSNDSFSDSGYTAVVQGSSAQGARINYGNSTIDRWLGAQRFFLIMKPYRAGYQRS